MKSDFNLFEIARKMSEEADQVEKQDGKDYFADKLAVVKNLKKAILMLIPSISEAFGRKLVEEEEVLMNLSDMLMQLFAAEATVLRVQKLESIRGTEANLIYRDILDVLVFDAASIAYKAGKDAVVSFAAAENQCKMLDNLYQLCKVRPVNVKDARRRIADKLIEDNQYNF